MDLRLKRFEGVEMWKDSSNRVKNTKERKVLTFRFQIGNPPSPPEADTSDKYAITPVDGHPLSSLRTPAAVAMSNMRIRFATDSSIINHSRIIKRIPIIPNIGHFLSD